MTPDSYLPFSTTASLPTRNTTRLRHPAVTCRWNALRPFDGPTAGIPEEV
ncbi:MAG: hypothetical protein ACLR6J_01390 [Parabacteroides merdae]